MTLYLVLKSDAEDVMNGLDGGKESPKILAKSDYGPAPTLTGTTPAGKDCTVVVASGGQQAELKAKIVGKY